MFLGKTNNKWAIKLAENFPKQTENKTAIITGEKNQILFSILLKIFGYKTIWLAQSPEFPKLIKFFSKFADKIVCPNQFVETKWLKIGITDKRLALVYPACEFEENQKITRYGSEACCDGDAKNQEGINSTIRACAEAKQILGNIKLTISGESSDKTSIEWLAQNLGIKNEVNVVFSQTNAWIKSCDIYIYFGQDGLEIPFSLAQAMAFGKPIIATSCPNVKEFIINDENGILLENTNQEEASLAIITIARNKELYQKFSQNNLNFAKNKFSEELLQKNINELLG